MEAGNEVKLYVYDLTKGLASTMSTALLGTHLDGIWHTSIVIFGREYFYGGGGIESCKPRGTILGQPEQVHDMGSTQVDYGLWLEYLGGLGSDEFCGERYNLFEHNCNTFSNEVCQFLTGNSIPSFILTLPHEVMNTPIGAMMKGLIESLSSNPTGRPVEGGGNSHRPAYDPVPLPSYSDTPAPPKPSTENPSTSTTTKPEVTNQNPTAKPEASASQSESKPSAAASTEEAGATAGARPTQSSADAGAPQAKADYDSDDEFIEKLKMSTPMEPLRLKVYTDINVLACVETIEKKMPEGLLTREEMKLILELKDCVCLEYLMEEPPSPVKSECFLVIGKLLNLAMGGIPPEVLHPLVDLLQMAFLSQDVIHTLSNNDDHTIMKFVSSSDCQPIQIQLSVFRMLCNICSSYQGKLWLTQVRHWTTDDGGQQSNLESINRLVVYGILSGSDELCCAASALVYNLTRYQVSDDSAVEFSSALLQSLTSETISEETAYYNLLALYGLMKCGEVMCLATVMGLDTIRYAKVSERLNKLCSDIDSVIG